MNVDLTKTKGHDLGRRNGKSACHKILTTPIKDREAAILRDIEQFVNEAGFAKDQSPIARLLGYCHGLAKALVLAEACGVQFVTNTNAYGTESLGARIDFPNPLSNTTV